MEAKKNERNEDLKRCTREDRVKKKCVFADDSGIGVVEIILILVVLIALVLIFKNQITKIVQDAFSSITGNADAIIK